jgi:hypothetical protein
VERCLACEADAVGTGGALPRLRGRGKQGDALLRALSLSALYSRSLFHRLLLTNLAGMRRATAGLDRERA